MNHERLKLVSAHIKRRSVFIYEYINIFFFLKPNCKGTYGYIILSYSINYL